MRSLPTVPIVVVVVEIVEIGVVVIGGAVASEIGGGAVFALDGGGSISVALDNSIGATLMIGAKQL